MKARHVLMSLAALLAASATGAEAKIARFARRDVTDFGAKCDGVTNDAAAIQAAINAAAASGFRLTIPAGTCIVVPATPVLGAGGWLRTALTLASNLHIQGEPGAILKIADGVSTDAAPVWMAMFSDNRPLTNISITGLTMDMNGAENPISPNRRSLSYNTYNQAQIFVSGDGARVDNFLIKDDRFINGPGTSCIVMGQSNTPGAALGSHWMLYHNLFKNNGLDTNDHSSVYAWASDVVANGNTFTSDLAYGNTGLAGPLVAFEIHGSNTRFVHSSIKNYYQGLWIASNYTAPVSHSIVANDTFSTIVYGVNFFIDLPPASAITDTLIENNTFIFDDTVVAAAPPASYNFKSAVAIAEGTQARVTIRGNRAFKTGTAIASTFLNVAGGATAVERQTEIHAEGNAGKGLTFGDYIQTSTNAGLGVISARDNNWTNLTPAGIFAIAAGDALSPTASQPIDTLILGGGSMIDTRGRPRNTYGVYLRGAVTHISLLPYRKTNIPAPEVVADPR